MDGERDGGRVSDDGAGALVEDDFVADLGGCKQEREDREGMRM